jgi:hypothetical protein
MLKIGDVMNDKAKREDKTGKQEKPVRYWMGSIGETDDFGAPIKDVFVDGVTTQGPWAIMSPASHRMYGRGLGTGLGQRYVKVLGSDQKIRWMKTEG